MANFWLDRRALGRLLASAATALFIASSACAGDRVVVFAAASLKTALDSVRKKWEADAHKSATISYAASSSLAKQIMEGAPADVFVSADMDWMDELANAKAIVPGSVHKLLGNDIVLIVPTASQTDIKIEQGFDLTSLLGDSRLAMADVKSVPAGKYGKAALEALGVWPLVQDRIAMAENVRAALKLVASGEAPAGIVYATDAKAEPAVRVVGVFPAATHAEIVYPVGLVSTSKNADAVALLAYLQGKEARTIFEDQGFKVLPLAPN